MKQRLQKWSSDVPIPALAFRGRIGAFDNSFSQPGRDFSAHPCILQLNSSAEADKANDKGQKVGIGEKVGKGVCVHDEHALSARQGISIT